MVCPNCGNQAQDTAVFCDQCGTRLSQPAAAATPVVASPAPVTATPAPRPVAAGGVPCTNCGYANIPGEMFCDNCGNALEAPSPESAPAVEVVEAASAPVASAAPAVAEVQATASAASGVTCPACRAAVGAADEFCDNCGATLKGIPTMVEPAAATQPSATFDAMPVVPRLVVASSGAEIPLPAGSNILIGREDPISGIFPDIDLTPHGGEEGGVSRKHARIHVQNGGFVIEDLNSTNFTWVNQQRLTPGSPHPVQDGAELRFGRVRMILKTGA